MAAYTDSTGALTNEFNQAVAIYMWAWFIVSCLFTVSSYKSTWVIFIDLIMVDILLLLLACGFMVGVQGLMTAGYSFGIVVCFLTCKSPFLSKLWNTADCWRSCRLCWLYGDVGRHANPRPTPAFCDGLSV